MVRMTELITFGSEAGGLFELRLSLGGGAKQTARQAAVAEGRGGKSYSICAMLFGQGRTVLPQ